MQTVAFTPAVSTTPYPMRVRAGGPSAAPDRTAQGGTAQGGTAQGGTAQGGTAQGGIAQGGIAQGGVGQDGTPASSPVTSLPVAGPAGSPTSGGANGSPGTNATAATNAPGSGTSNVPASGTPAAGASSSGQSQGPTAPDGKKLTKAQEDEIAKLKARDRQVHAHEMAHMMAGGQYSGAPHYDYQVGPDGQRYAIGGETPISVGAVSDNPKATVAKMETVIRAALAPAQPSDQDRRVAAQAAATLAKAESQLQTQKADGGSGSTSGDSQAQGGASDTAAGGADPPPPGSAQDGAPGNKLSARYGAMVAAYRKAGAVNGRTPSGSASIVA